MHRFFTITLLCIFLHINVSYASPDKVANAYQDSRAVIHAHNIIFHGVTVFKESALRKILDKYEQIPANSLKVQNIVTEVNKYYNSAGYSLATVYKINIDKDILSLWIAEGAINDVYILGEHSLKNTPLVQYYVEKIKAMRPYNRFKADPYLQLLKRVLGDSIQIHLEPIKHFDPNIPFFKNGNIVIYNYNRVIGMFEMNRATAYLDDNRIKQGILPPNPLTLGSLAFHIHNIGNYPNTFRGSIISSGSETDNGLEFLYQHQINRQGTLFNIFFDYDQIATHVETDFLVHDIRPHNFKIPFGNKRRINPYFGHKKKSVVSNPRYPKQGYSKKSHIKIGIGMRHPLWIGQDNILELFGNVQKSFLDLRNAGKLDSRMSIDTIKFVAGLHHKAKVSKWLSHDCKIEFHNGVSNLHNPKRPNWNIQNFIKFVFLEKITAKLSEDFNINLYATAQYTNNERIFEDEHFYPHREIFHRKFFPNSDQDLLRGSQGMMGVIEFRHHNSFDSKILLGMDQYVYFSHAMVTDNTRRSLLMREYANRGLNMHATVLGFGYETSLVGNISFRVELAKLLGETTKFKGNINDNSDKRFIDERTKHNLGYPYIFSIKLRYTFRF